MVCVCVFGNEGHILRWGRALGRYGHVILLLNIGVYTDFRFGLDLVSVSLWEIFGKGGFRSRIGVSLALSNKVSL